MAARTTSTSPATSHRCGPVGRTVAILAVTAAVMALAVTTKPSDALRPAVDHALDRDTVLVTGAGNHGRTGNEVTYPVAVAATDNKGAVRQDSHHGKHVTIAAPGVDVLTTARDGGYRTGSGTQHAASAALLRSEHPRRTGGQVVRKLNGTAAHKGSPGRDARYGFGIVTPAAAPADRTAPSAASSPSAHAAVPAVGPAANGQDSFADRSEDPAAPPALTTVGAGLIVLAAVAWFLINRGVSPFRRRLAWWTDRTRPARWRRRAGRRGPYPSNATPGRPSIAPAYDGPPQADTHPRRPVRMVSVTPDRKRPDSVTLSPRPSRPSPPTLPRPAPRTRSRTHTAQPDRPIRVRPHSWAARIPALVTVLALLVGLTTMTPHLPPLPPRPPLFPASTRFSTDPDTAAARWVRDHPQDTRAAVIAKHIASRPQASWFPDSDPATTGEHVRKAVAAARAQGAVPVLVPYAVPRRDCAGHSPGGAVGLAAYRQWIDTFARAIGPATAVVVLEPDSLALMDCLTPQERQDRLAALTYAGRTLRRDAPNAHLYYDAGHSRWHPADTIADRLRHAGAPQYADGIALNVSNFNATGDEARHGLQVIRTLGATDLGMVIDTSRSGAGPARGNPYCDPPGRRLGHSPTADTGLDRVDAYLWVKPPGEADGCAAAAGTFDPQYAYLLAG